MNAEAISTVGYLWVITARGSYTAVSLTCVRSITKSLSYGRSNKACNLQAEGTVYSIDMRLPQYYASILISLTRCEGHYILNLYRFLPSVYVLARFVG